MKRELGGSRSQSGCPSQLMKNMIFHSGGDSVVVVGIVPRA